MAARLIDGKAIAKEIRQELAQEVARLRSEGLNPGLTVVLVGDDPASQSYVRGKEKAAQEIGFNSQVIRLPAETSREELLELVHKLNADPAVHGILVQLPLPRPEDEEAVLLAIDPAKDVDGFHPMNVGKLHTGQPTLVPCTPQGVMVMLERMGVSLKGKHAVVVGRSNIVGKPLSMLLLAQHATVTICHSRTADLGAITRQADVLLAAVGRAGLVTADMVKPGAVVIDVGVNRTADGKLVGDVAFGPVSEVASAITPVPGGVGPMTIAMLMANTVEAAKRQAGRGR